MKFFEHFLGIAAAMNNAGGKGIGLCESSPGSARDSRAPAGDSPVGFDFVFEEVRGESPRMARESRALPGS